MAVFPLLPTTLSAAFVFENSNVPCLLLYIVVVSCLDSNLFVLTVILCVRTLTLHWPKI